MDNVTRRLMMGSSTKPSNSVAGFTGTLSQVYQWGSYDVIQTAGGLVYRSLDNTGLNWAVAFGSPPPGVITYVSSLGTAFIGVSGLSVSAYMWTPVSGIPLSTDMPSGTQAYPQRGVGLPADSYRTATGAFATPSWMVGLGGGGYRAYAVWTRQNQPGAFNQVIAAWGDPGSYNDAGYHSTISVGTLNHPSITVYNTAYGNNFIVWPRYCVGPLLSTYWYGLSGSSPVDPIDPTDCSAIHINNDSTWLNLTTQNYEYKGGYPLNLLLLKAFDKHSDGASAVHAVWRNGLTGYDFHQYLYGAPITTGLPTTLNWQGSGSDPFGASRPIIRDMAYSESLNLKVAVFDGGRIFTSPNVWGNTWTERSSGTTKNLTSVNWSTNMSKFIAVGQQGALGVSSDGITWSF